MRKIFCQKNLLVLILAWGLRFWPSAVGADDQFAVAQAQDHVFHAALIAARSADIGPAQALLDIAEPHPTARPEALDLPAAKVSLTDLRLALAQLTLVSGANDQLLVLRAQAQIQPRALTISGGAISLAALKRAAQDLPQPGGTALWGPQGLNVPLVIWQDAALQLRPGDQLELSRPHGAFLLNFGQLTADRAVLHAVGGTNPRAAGFRPFVATVGTGSAQIWGSAFAGLGFGQTAAFSGVSFVNGGVFRPRHISEIIGSRFADIGGITLRGTTGAQLAGNLIVKARGPAVDLRGTEASHLSNNVIVDAAARGAIRVTREARGSVVRGNVLLANKGVGIEIGSAGPGTVVAGNLIWAQGQAAIAVTLTDCLRVTGNQLLASGAKGITLRSVRQALLTDNRIERSRSAGLAITGQAASSQIALHGNRFQANRSGISGAGSGALLLSRNDFSQQLPQIVAGDLAGQSAALLSDLYGVRPVHLTTPTSSEARRPTASCALWQEAM
ncbi:right-handed parallel beta-helix repeat-containing protein [Cognatishimia sp. SS12]|uniref:right-handed parallel beta-helix repeat-containing protein n=1 Tax=Cognatishimia sp. SS12 TaxID=2979465 RepID=UPI0023314027|nr:right-handed parallel beta-helix repeat-containing protein [Cognatishimia sp. SS12]MDC0738706.1 right-handed parallel beta-helix repeat-containing protein [Cognatishimia sp. SS12]